MLKNYFKTAWRSLLKNRGLSAINIGGLAIGIASALMLLSYVTFEFSYDSFHANKKDLYRVNLSLYENNKLAFQSAENYSALAPVLKREFPEVLDAARLYNMGYKNNCVFTYNNHSFRETQFLYADPSFLKMFSYSFLKGDAVTALAQPYSAVISSSLSKKLFGNENPVGKLIKMDDDDRNAELCTITGVYTDVPVNAHLQFNILISYSTLHHRSNGRGIERFENNWDRKDFYTYVLLRPGTDMRTVESKLPTLISKYAPNEKSQNKRSVLSLQPLSKIHLTSGWIDEPGSTESEKAISFLITIAFFIITIAWVNYINMATAGSANRAKEIGVRKVLGSRKPELIKQFLVESFVVNSIAAIIAVLLVGFTRPLLEKFFHIEFNLSGLTHVSFGWMFIGFLVLGTLLSGLYPAFVLSSFKPVSVLKGKIKAKGGSLILRKSLVVFQFSLSIFMIIGTIVVYQQVHYMLNQGLGMNINHVLVLDRPGKWDTARKMHNTYVTRFKESLSGNPAIECIGMSDELPGKEIRYPSTYTFKGSFNPVSVPINTISIDENFFKALEFHFLAGRNFSQQFKTDNNGLVLTASAARLFGFKNVCEAVGKQVEMDNTNYSIVGIVNDYHQLSLQKEAEPIVFQFDASDAREFEYYLIKPNANSIAQAIETTKTAWNGAFKDNPFSFTFLDDYFNRQYQNIVQFESLFAVFALIAIIIACIGLFALIAFMIQQRIKEIGIRKVLGANMQNIITLLSKDFLRLVLIANLFAWPLGWLLMNNWLNDFAYRVQIQFTVFIVSSLSAVIIAMVTISVQAIKAAMANPVKSLRTE